MRNAVTKRLEALEQRHNQPDIPDGLGYFYSQPEAERERMTAHLYGNGQPIRSKEAVQ